MVKDTLEKLRALIAPPAQLRPDQALVLTGGGARAAFQVGVLQYIAQVFPEASFQILTGVSAGAINAAHLANHTGGFGQAAEHLAQSWHDITAEEIFAPESSFALMRRILGQSVDRKHPSETVFRVEEGQALLNTVPLRAYLDRKLQPVEGRLVGVTENVQQGRLKAACITATNYLTGQTVTWVQGCDIRDWQRANRVGVQTTLTVDHIMASSALPLLFPAARVGNAWYGDGGIRQIAPLSPAVHLGADSIFVISTRYRRSRQEADDPSVVGYPPAAQVMGLLMNAIFLDLLDQDALTMRRINALVRALPPKSRPFRPIKLLLLRPSQDLGRLAGEYEMNLKGALRLLTRGLGTGQTKSPDWLSMLLFHQDYLARLMQIGWEDARSHHEQIARFFDASVPYLADGVEV